MLRYLFWLITFVALQCHDACACIVGIRVAGSHTAFDYFSDDGPRHHFARCDAHYAYRDFGGLWLQQSGESRYYHLGYRLTEARDAVIDLARTYTWQVGWSGLQTPDGSVYPIPELRVETLAETDAGTVRFGYAGLRPLEPTVTTVTDARGQASTYTMNRYGATERLAAPAGTTLTEWDVTHLQPRAITDVLGTRTAWTFDAHGNRLSETVTHSAGTLSRHWSYVSPDAFAVPIKDRPRSATDARGLTTQYAYDARGRRTGQSRGGVTEAYGHAANGDLTSITNGASALGAGLRPSRPADCHDRPAGRDGDLRL